MCSSSPLSAGTALEYCLPEWCFWSAFTLEVVSLWGVIREVSDTDSSKPSVSYKGHYFKYVGIMRAESHAIHTKAGSLMNKLNKEGPITSGVKIKAFTHALEAGCPFDKAKSLPGFADGIVRNHNAT